MIGDTYYAKTIWGVRWGEKDTPVRCRDYGDEEECQAMYQHLVRRYEELGRTDGKPELIRALIVWEVVE